MRKTALALALSAATLALGGAAYAAPDDAAHHRPHHGPASRAEAQARTDELFARLDVNGDGLLDPKDREAGEARHFAMLDTDHDGALSPQEFAAAPRRGPGAFPGHFRGKGPAAPPPAGPARDGRTPPSGPMGLHGMPGGPALGAWFGTGPIAREADTDRDGAISKTEFEAFTLAHFDTADADHDGTLTTAERKDARQAHRGERIEKYRALRADRRARHGTAGE